MTVRDLIAQLLKCPSEAKVKFFLDEEISCELYDVEFSPPAGKRNEGAWQARQGMVLILAYQESKEGIYE